MGTFLRAVGAIVLWAVSYGLAIQLPQTYVSHLVLGFVLLVAIGWSFGFRWRRRYWHGYEGAPKTPEQK